jgi:hypothetical protein
MAEITDAERAEYDQLKRIAAARSAQANNADEVTPDQLVSSRALLADGTLHDYLGAHPTHVDNGAGPVPVMACYNV